MADTFIITAESAPDLDDWGPDSYWDCPDWITWHRLVEAKYGLDEANRKFIEAFESQSIGAHAIDCRTFNDEFKRYAKEKGFYNGLFDGIGALALPLSTGTSVVTSAANIVGSAADTASDFAKYLPWIIGIVALLIILAIASSAYSKFKQVKTITAK